MPSKINNLRYFVMSEGYQIHLPNGDATGFDDPNAFYVKRKDAEALARRLIDKGVTNVRVLDVCD